MSSFSVPLLGLTPLTSTHTDTHTSLLTSGCAIILAYLCGSLPTGVWVGRRAGVDVQHAGSGNIGATNVARTAGRRAALVTLAGDVVKGLLPVVIARVLVPTPWTVAAVGAAAVVGHVYSVWLRFSGGKGVATAGGVFLALAPLALAPALAVFVAVAVCTRYVSLASVAAAVSLPLAAALLGYAAPVLASATCIGLLIVLRHRDNLSRLWHHTEPRFEARR